MLQLNKIYNTDCKEGMKLLPDNSISSIVTDPPYGLSKEPNIVEVLTNWLNNEEYIHNSKGFMGKDWDSFVPNPSIWKEAYRVLKPGGYLLCFAGTRTYDLMCISLRLAGFEIRDQIDWIYGCLSEDTEILTLEGWKNYNNININDEIFSMNLSNNKIIKKNVNYIYKYNYDGNMVNLINDNTDQLLTLNHKVICKEGRRICKNHERKVVWDNNLKYKDAKFIDSEYYVLPLAGYYEGTYSIGKDFSELIGWILSEGHFHKDTNAISIYQSSVNIDKVRRIKYILGRLKIKYSHYQREREYKERKYTEHQFYFSGNIVDKIKEIIPNKKPTNNLWNLPLREKERLFNGLCLGDGTKGNRNNFQAFYQKDIQFLEWFQVLLHLMGKQGRININKYSCSINHSDSTEIQMKHYPNRLVKYEGIVWCIETEIGNFIARRNGKIFITGNSGFPKSMDISKQIDKKFGAEREIVGEGKYFNRQPNGLASCNVTGFSSEIGKRHGSNGYITEPSTDEAKQFNGYGTALKPAHEPIIVARKPLSEKTIVDNILKWNTGGINIDDCRIELNGDYKSKPNGRPSLTRLGDNYNPDNANKPDNQGRFPANIIMDEYAGKILDLQSGITKSGKVKENKDAYKGESNTGFLRGKSTLQNQHGDTGGASRYFKNILYCEDDYICGNIIENLKVAGILNGVIQEIEQFIQNVEQDIHGNNIMEKFLLDLKYIILMVTNLTIELKIWNYYQNINIKSYMEMQEKIIKLLMELNIENVKTVENIKILMNFIKEMNVIKDIVKSVQEKNYESGDILTKNIIINTRENIKEKKENYINFMYCAKASKKERGEGNNHPCVKPLSLIKYLVTLVTPPNGICLDPFEGSGTTFIACQELGFDHIGFEMNKEYCDIAEKRLSNKL